MADKEVKPRNKKTPALEPEEFAKEVEAVHAQWRLISDYYSGVTKRKFKAGDSTPSKIEFNSVGKMLDSLPKPYTKMAKKPKRKVTVNPDAKKSKGFKQERYFLAAGVAYVNAHGQLPDPLKLEPLADLGGDAVWQRAQATQFFSDAVKALKDPNEKTRVTFDAPLTALFKPFLDTIDRKKWTLTAEGNIIVDHKTLQSLISKLFEKNIPVIPKHMTEETKRRLAEREVLLGKRTETNRDAREAVAKAAKEAKGPSKAAKAAPAAAAAK